MDDGFMKVLGCSGLSQFDDLNSKCPPHVYPRPSTRAIDCSDLPRSSHKTETLEWTGSKPAGQDLSRPGQGHDMAATGFNSSINRTPLSEASSRIPRSINTTPLSTTPASHLNTWQQQHSTSSRKRARSHPAAPLRDGLCTAGRARADLDVPTSFSPATRGASIPSQDEEGEPSSADSTIRVNRLRPASSHGSRPQASTHGVMMEAIDMSGQAARSANNGQDSWGRVMVDAVAGIAGKVWGFCKAGTFHGFHAGGGQGYDMDESGLQQAGHEGLPIDRARRSPSLTTKIPGQFPVEEEEQVEQKADEEMPNKRLHTSKDDWIVVNGPETRRTPTPKISASPLRHHPPAAVRVSIARRSRVSSARVGSAHIATVTPGLRRAPSTAMLRSPSMSTQLPLSPATAVVAEDVHRYSAKRKRELKQNDASLRRLNEQLQTMIRQGKDALNSTVEVESDDGNDDDGFQEDEGLVGI